MSLVTNVILSVYGLPGSVEDEWLKEINLFFSHEEDYLKPFEAGGGNKPMFTTIYGGGYNYFDHIAFCKHVKSLEDKMPKTDICVQLLIGEERFDGVLKFVTLIDTISILKNYEIDYEK